MTSPTAQGFMDAAEVHFKSSQVEVALSLANLAKQRDPNFDFVDQFIAAYEVHVAAAQKKNNDNIDWYGVLGIVDASVDTETIKKCYKKLALMVHPDKNTSAAAEDAFKLVSEAWNVLSQPSSRKAYDILWGPRPSKNPHKGTSRSSSSPSSPTATSSLYGANTRPPRTCAEEADETWDRFGCGPNCHIWCNHYFGGSYVFPYSYAHSVPPRYPTEVHTKVMCPLCTSNCKYSESDDLVTMKCLSCKFEFSVPSTQGSKSSFYNIVSDDGQIIFCFKGNQ